MQREKNVVKNMMIPKLRIMATDEKNSVMHESMTPIPPNKIEKPERVSVSRTRSLALVLLESK